MLKILNPKLSVWFNTVEHQNIFGPGRVCECDKYFKAFRKRLVEEKNAV